MKIKKRVLFISSSAKNGGGPSHLFLLKEILKDDFDFYFAMPKIDLTNKNIDFEKYLEIAERKVLLRDIFKLISFAKKNSIDIIHAHGRGASLFGRILKIISNKPLIYTFHGIHIDCLSTLKKIIYILYENVTGWIDNEKIFVSSSELQKAKYSKIIIRNNFSIINNSTGSNPFKGFDNKSLNIRFGIKNQKKNIISVCRLVSQKNIFEIFNIAKNLPIYNFIILGDGYLYNQAIKYIELNNIKNVYLLGNKENIFKYLYMSDLFLSCSLYEGHPISILEAMSVGLPIVASKVIGNVDTFKNNESGFLYKLGDLEDACLCIKKIMQNENLKKKFSINSHNMQRKLFNTNKMRNCYSSLYKKYYQF